MGYIRQTTGIWKKVKKKKKVGKEEKRESIRLRGLKWVT